MLLSYTCRVYIIMNFHEYNFCLVFCFQCVYSVLVVTIFLVLSWFLHAILQNLRNMLLFQYLVSFLEGDFLPRKTMYAGKSISIGTLKKKRGSISIIFVLIKILKILIIVFSYCRNNELDHFAWVLSQHASGTLSLLNPQTLIEIISLSLLIHPD